MRRMLAPLIVLASLTTLGGLGPSVDAATPVFGPVVVVHPTDFGGEPGIDVDSTGYLYENAPSGGGASWVYRSANGATWTRGLGPFAPTGGFDSDGAIDDCDTFYMSDLYIGGATLHVTKDRGQTWISQPITLASAPGDRQWLETGPGCGVLYAVWENLATGLWIAKSADGGVTWPLQKNVAGPTDLIGSLVVDKADGTVYISYAKGGYHLLVSRDGGNTWTDRVVYAAPQGTTLADSFPVVAVDKGSNVYAVWEQDTVTGKGQNAVHRFDIYYAWSTDHGATWSTPRLIQSGSTGSNVFPWAVGGEAGHLDVVWYRAPAGHADPNRNTGPWHVAFAQSLSATSGGPFTTVLATPTSIHNDVICTSGTGCSGDSRDLLDFFQVALKPNGMAVIAFTLDTTNVAAGTGDGDPRNAFVMQVGGDPA